MQPLLMQLRELFTEADFPWGVCGGYALELFAGKAIRPHGDIDLCLPESARTAVIAYLLDRGWKLHEYRGMGRVKPIRIPADSEAGRNLMASLGDASPVQFFPCEEEGLLYHQFMPGMTELNFLDLLFSPDAEQALLLREGMPILAPEIALLYKATQAHEPSAQQDFEGVYPRMAPLQKEWFQHALAEKYPQGHPWRE